jgi:4'-phosphopantetheinyl transferase
VKPDPGDLPPLHDREVHVWTAALDVDEAEIADLRRLLDELETARASRFRFDRDRNAFVTTRGILRRLLAHYVGGRPDEIRFAYGEFGKPSLRDASAPIRFNVSHSEGIALLAFSRSAEVGVDVERVRELPDRDQVAERFFSGPEVDALRHLSPDERDAGFFRCWTAKEAYIKGIGEGLSMPLNRFAVSLDPFEGPVELQLLERSPKTDLWRIHRFSSAPGYVGALALTDDGLRPRFLGWAWHPPVC